MIVVSDTTTVSNLLTVGRADLLVSFFSTRADTARRMGGIAGLPLRFAGLARSRDGH